MVCVIIVSARCPRLSTSTVLFRYYQMWNGLEPDSTRDADELKRRVHHHCYILSPRAELACTKTTGRIHQLNTSSTETVFRLVTLEVCSFSAHTGSNRKLMSLGVPDVASQFCVESFRRASDPLHAAATSHNAQALIHFLLAEK